MVRDGIYYAAALAAGGGILTYLTSVWFGLPLFLAAAFCAYFFRDPDRAVPTGRVAVSPADGKVVAVIPSGNQTRISIFLNIFDVHVNRAPISGSISEVKYRKGLFLAANKEKASARNEMNTVTVEGEGTRVVFKQIAGLIARRIVFTKKPGDFVNAGERVGLIKFGSRVDVILGPEWNLEVRPGMRVSGGSSVLARRSDVPEVSRNASRTAEESLPCRT